MRVARLLPAFALLAGCGDPSVPDFMGPPPDFGSVDRTPICLPVEPAPPMVNPDCPVQKPAKADALDDTLTAEGLDRCTLTLKTSGYPGGRDAYRLPWYDRVHDYPVNAPAFTRTLTSRLDEAAASTTPVARQLLLLGNRLVAEPIAACHAVPELDPERPLARAVAALITATGGTPDENALVAAASGVPLTLQLAVARAVYALSDANDDWKALTSGMSSDDLYYLGATAGIVLPGASGGGFIDLTDPAIKALLSRTFDEGALVAGAARLAAAIEEIDWAKVAGDKGFSFDVQTPIGRVVVHGGGDDTYEDDDADAIALLVDTGGKDTYRKPVGAVGGAQVVGEAPGTRINVAVAIDLGGEDLYAYAEEPDPLDNVKDKAAGPIMRLPSDLDGRHRRVNADDYGPITLSDQVRQGGARLGYGMLFDLGKDADHYRSLRMSQGFGVAGVGVLYDAGGDDLYEGEAGVQGSAVFGVGLLLDAGGSDTYRTYADSQGFAYVRAVGLLYDGGGSDKYLADSGIPSIGGDPIYPSPQAPCKGNGICGNSSFVQGVGFGRRAPGGGDNAFMSGGLGVLRDVSGNDVYLASIFGQASGYWFGTGILADGAGNDTYDGWWYTQGSDAHAALCIFEDTAGDDKYDVTYPMNGPYATNTGQGHDYSVGWHLDWSGNDIYRAPGLGLGGGNDHGGGFFINVGGDDSYETGGGTVLGGTWATPDIGRPLSLPCYGLFLDVGGKDTYKVPPDPKLQPPPADDTQWTNSRNDPSFTGNKSIGVDRAMGTVSLP